MKQPRGFIHLDYLHYVCKLKKALYGLKQAPRAWFHRFSSFLLSHGFVCSTADPFMFVLCTGSHILVLLLYVDDIILTGSSTTLLHFFISTLPNQFAMNDLGGSSLFPWSSGYLYPCWHFPFATEVCC